MAGLLGELIFGDLRRLPTAPLRFWQREPAVEQALVVLFDQDRDDGLNRLDLFAFSPLMR